jgi:hypothetical protein
MKPIRMSTGEIRAVSEPASVFLKSFGYSDTTEVPNDTTPTTRPSVAKR